MTEPKAPKAAHLAPVQENAFLLPRKRSTLADEELTDAERVMKGIRLKMTASEMAQEYGMSVGEVKAISYKIRCEWKESILDDLHTMMVDELASVNADERDLRVMFNAGMFSFHTDPSSIQDKDFVNNMTKIYSAISTAQDKRHALTGLKAPSRLAVHSTTGTGLITQVLTILTSVVKDPNQLKEITHQMEGLVEKGKK